MARKWRSLGSRMISGVGRRRWRAIGQQMTVVMGLLFSVVLVQSLAGASTEVTMQAPYDRSGFEGNAVADHLTGVLSASAVCDPPIPPGVYPAAPGYCSRNDSAAWIEADHQLTADTSSIDYVVDLERAEFGAWFAASACGGGYCSEEVTQIHARLEFTLAPPQDLPAGTTVTVRLSVASSAEAFICNPLVIGGCVGGLFGFISGLADAVPATGHGRVVSITATVHRLGDPEPTPTPSPTVWEIQLDAHEYKQKGLQKADLSWSGASSSSIDLYRDGAVIATTENDGVFTDHIDQRGKGTYTYRVCEAGTATCSNEATVEF